jgi:hypothetical protein
MVFNRISAVLFFLSAFCIILMISGYIPLSNPFYFWGGFIGLGSLAFLFSMISVFYDKQRKAQNLNPIKGITRYLGMFVVFIGFTFTIFHYPYSRILLFAGILITAASVFMKVKADKSVDSDVLDDDF